MFRKVISYFINHPIVPLIMMSMLVLWGIVVAPFDWNVGILPSSPVATDAIPDISENQQIVITKWMGRSPQDVEDQITYPLTSTMLGLSGVKTIRSSSLFGLSSIQIIFKENVDFYWSRSRILEKLSSLPSGLLPENVNPSLGPEATALGQVFWYTIEGRDSKGNPTDGWDLHEIRTIQDFYVKYALSSSDGVAEIASIGGYIKEYQVKVEPEKMRLFGISLKQVVKAVKQTNQDIGAQTVEINRAEYLVRGLGSVETEEDIEKAVVAIHGGMPIYVKDIAKVTIGPRTRRGLLDKEGEEVVGGVVTATYGANPMKVIADVKKKILEISSGLPKKTLSNGTETQLQIIPFYDRTQLIKETLNTLNYALILEVLITILVVIIMLLNIRASLMISAMLPLAILMVFIAMKFTNVQANIVSLSGIAIAIGTMVDLGIILTENILNHLNQRKNQSITSKERVIEAVIEVSPAIFTAVATTIVSFLPVFALEAAEGKLFRPLAMTKTFALFSSLFVSIIILPMIAHRVFSLNLTKVHKSRIFHYGMILLGLLTLIYVNHWAGVSFILLGIAKIVQHHFGNHSSKLIQYLPLYVSVFSIMWLLSETWMPLSDQSLFINGVFITIIVGIVITFFLLIKHFYEPLLHYFLKNKALFFFLPILIIMLGYSIWQSTSKEFMPSLDEGTFLLMPVSMPHAGVVQNKEVIQRLDRNVANLSEIEQVVGKMGRAETALDPAPIAMYENIINYKSEYVTDEKGRKIRYKTDNNGKFILKSGRSFSNDELLLQGWGSDSLIIQNSGKPLRNWRSKIRSKDDIWKEIVKVTHLPGVTTSPKLQPIETRLVMLQTGMRAPIGIKIYAQNLESIEHFGKKLEEILKEVPSINSSSVFADRIVGKPYIHLNIDRDAISNYGLSISEVQEAIAIAIGGVEVSNVVKGRERIPISVRYPRLLRENPDDFKKILVTTPMNMQIPLEELVNITYEKGPQMIKSENSFLVGYVLMSKSDGFTDVDAVKDAQHHIQQKINTGKLKIPPGITYEFTGTYENHVRSEKRLALLMPMVFLIIFLILYFQFKSISTAIIIFFGIAIAFGGGFIFMWLYSQDWFLNFYLFGQNMRTLIQIQPIFLSVAVWVGFIALFGIATDDGVIIGKYLDDQFKKHKPTTIQTIRKAVIQSGKKRIKPAVMTSATTIIALMPILMSDGRGSDIMKPMAIPILGGMLIATITYFVVPICYCLREEWKIKKNDTTN